VRKGVGGAKGWRRKGKKRESIAINGMRKERRVGRVGKGGGRSKGRRRKRRKSEASVRGDR